MKKYYFFYIFVFSFYSIYPLSWVSDFFFGKYELINIAVFIPNNEETNIYNKRNYSDISEININKYLAVIFDQKNFNFRKLGFTLTFDYRGLCSVWKNYNI